MFLRPANDNRHRFLQGPVERRHAPLLILAFVLSVITGERRTAKRTLAPSYLDRRSASKASKMTSSSAKSWGALDEALASSFGA
jgi:hypothetical protein